MKKIPIGIQHFPALIEEGYLYVDKTQHIYHLLADRGHFFSRPRRFGKSLLISTLASIFQGKRELFQDTWIGSSDYQWQNYPTIWLDFSTLAGQDKDSIELSLQQALIYAAEDASISLSKGITTIDTFIALIRNAAKQNPAVILIDEYDHPLLKMLDNPAELIKTRNLFNDFYSVIKALNRYVRYVFITGVSKFAKVSLFSGMNNLHDITLDSNYATLAGITENELLQYYPAWITQTAQKREEPESDVLTLMRLWYNGYCFSKAKVPSKVYNPVSLHLFFQEASLSNFWFSTATPTFAIDLIRSENYPVINFENDVKIGLSLEENHEVNYPHLIPLLFQTGYLTIKHYDEQNQIYSLNFPNEEVRLSFFNHLLIGFTKLDETQLSSHFTYLTLALQNQRLEEFFSVLNVLLAEIPYTLHIAKEAYYHSLIYLIMRGLKVKVEAEVSTSLGRLDLIVDEKDKIYIFEFKFDISAQEALSQILQKEYFARFQNHQKKIILVGVKINRIKRKIDEWAEMLL